MSNQSLGFGIGFRPQHYHTITASTPKSIDWLEIISENFMGVGGKPRHFLELLRAQYPVAMHGVGLSIAGCEPLDAEYLKKMKALKEWLKPALVTDHLCWTSHRGSHSFDLLPFPLTEESLTHVSSRVTQVQEFLGTTICLENPSVYIQFKGDEFTEAEFLRALCKKTGCGILLDVNNLFVNLKNLGIDPVNYMETLHPSDVKQFHLAGHSVYPDIRIDTHDHPVPNEVWDLYQIAAAKWPNAATLLEWDDQIPDLSVLEAELAKARRRHEAPWTGDSAHLHSKTSDGRAAAPAAKLQESQTLLWNLLSSQTGMERSETLAALCHDHLPAQTKRGLEVYNDGYFLRIYETMVDFFPTVLFIVEEQNFKILVAEFIQSSPRRDFSLNEVGKGFDGFLLAYPDMQKRFGAPAAVLAAIATLDEVSATTFVAEDDNEGLLTPEAMAAFTPEDWDKLTVAFTPSVRLLTLACDAISVRDAVAKNEIPPVPELKTQHCLVYRRNFNVECNALSELEAELFKLLSVGTPLSDSWGMLEESHTELKPEQLIKILATWCQLGLVKKTS
jgi:uncharacterized protein (UPF0276 family)